MYEFSSIVKWLGLILSAKTRGHFLGMGNRIMDWQVSDWYLLSRTAQSLDDYLNIHTYTVNGYWHTDFVNCLCTVEWSIVELGYRDRNSMSIAGDGLLWSNFYTMILVSKMIQLSINLYWVAKHCIIFIKRVYKYSGRKAFSSTIKLVSVGDWLGTSV